MDLDGVEGVMAVRRKSSRNCGRKTNVTAGDLHEDDERDAMKWHEEVTYAQRKKMKK